MQAKRTTTWLADKAFFAHTVLTLFGFGWGYLTGEPVFVLLVFLLWLANCITWMEWRHAF